MTIIEAVPNVSEGRQPEVIRALIDSVSGTPGVALLDISSDPSHNRSVLTLVGDPPGLKTALVALYAAAIPRIDLRQHRGAHPRLGAVDVVPLVPLRDATIATSVTLARELAEEVARRFALPVYLYEEAARIPERRHLEEIRRGQFEQLAVKMAEPGWQPDVGPLAPHPSAGATVIGVRPLLIAYNINLDTADLDTARAIAAAVRQRGGGLQFVKAMAVDLAHRRIAQVSMNLTNYEATPLDRVFDAVKREADRRGVSILDSEIVGMVPAAALLTVAARHLRLEGFRLDHVLDLRLGSRWAIP